MPALTGGPLRAISWPRFQFSAVPNVLPNIRTLFAIATLALVQSSASDAADSSCSRGEKGSDKPVFVPCNERLAGDWGGLLTEANGNTYRADISLSKDGNGTISYGKLNCSGTLTYRSRQGAKYSYREEITEGVDKCTTGGDVELTAVAAEGSALEFYWTGSSLTVKGRVSGVMTAGVTNGGNTTSSPSSDGKDACSRYLPNRETWVPMACSDKEDEDDTELMR